MPVTEQLMAVGDWSVRLKSTIPKAITSPLDLFFGHIIITPSRFPPEALDASPNYVGAEKTILLVVGDSTSLTDGDVVMRDWLGYAGHKVTIGDDSAAELTTTSVYHLAVIAPSCVAATIGTKYRGRIASALPVLHMQSDAWGSTRGAFFNPGTTTATGSSKYVYYPTGADTDFAWPGQTVNTGSTIRFFGNAGNGRYTAEALWTGGVKIMAPSAASGSIVAFSYALGDAGDSGPGATTSRVVGLGPQDALLGTGIHWPGADWLSAAIEWLAPAVAPGDAYTLLDASIYTGIVRRLRRSSTGAVELSGPGLAAWLGDESGKGVIQSVAPPAVAGFGGWFTHVQPVALDTGTRTHPDPGTLFSPTYAWQTPRQILDSVCDYWAGEWRITHDAKLHGGTAAVLYGTAPKAWALADGALDPLFVTERALAGAVVTSEWSADDVTTAMSAVGTGAVGSAMLDPDADPGMPWRSLFGAPVDYRAKIDATDMTTTAQLDALAATELARSGVWRQITVETTEYLPTRFAPVGSIIGVYAPRVDLEDISNPQTLGGRTVFPVQSRLLRASWPIAPGCGVYLRSGFAGLVGQTIDLTDWVEYETGTSKLDVDAIRTAPNVRRDRRFRR